MSKLLSAKKVLEMVGIFADAIWQNCYTHKNIGNGGHTGRRPLMGSPEAPKSSASTNLHNALHCAASQTPYVKIVIRKKVLEMVGIQRLEL